MQTTVLVFCSYKAANNEDVVCSNIMAKGCPLNLSAKFRLVENFSSCPKIKKTKYRARNTPVVLMNLKAR